MIKAVFEVEGGLGDNLQKSTIPRVMTEQGHAVYLNYGFNDGWIHNEEIKRMVWEMNPYLRGFTDEPPTILRQGSPPNVHDDFIKNWESYYGVEPRNSYPEIYYRPRKLRGIDVVFELSWLSGDYTAGTVLDMAGRIVKLHGAPRCKQITSKYQKNSARLDDVERIECETIFDLADVLGSASAIVTLSSGPHMLAAAIHKGTIPQYCIMPEYLPPFPHYRLPKVTYKYPEGFRS